LAVKQLFPFRKVWLRLVPYEGVQFVKKTIPKRIVQIWGGGKEMPLLAKAAAANIRLLNPEFEYLLFDDDRIESFINEHFPEYRSVFDAFRFPIQRYDFLRYLIIYRLGGFYFDLDVFLAMNLSELLDSGCVFPFEALTINPFLRQEYGMDWEVGNYAFGAAAGHPFLRSIIENCVRAQKDQDWVRPMMRPIPRMIREEFSVLYTSGPGLVTRTLAEFPDAGTHVEILFPENVCDQQYWSRFGAYGIHLGAGTWRRKGFLMRKLIAIWISRQTKMMVRESEKLGGERSLAFKGNA
jgi:hypothetical protein